MNRSRAVSVCSDFTSTATDRRTPSRWQHLERTPTPADRPLLQVSS
jgi:hypothetical protein